MNAAAVYGVMIVRCVYTRKFGRGRILSPHPRSRYREAGRNESRRCKIFGGSDQPNYHREYDVVDSADLNQSRRCTKIGTRPQGRSRDVGWGECHGGAARGCVQTRCATAGVGC